MSEFYHNTRLLKGGFWLIQLRWLAVLGIILATYTAYFVFDISIHYVALSVIAIILFVMNVFSYQMLKAVRDEKIKSSYINENNLINFQISTDLIILTCLLHYSGGVENPFVIYYIFHMIIASILLNPRISYFQTSFALVLLCTLTWLEYHEMIPHYSLDGFNSANFYQNKAFLVGTGFIFVTTSYLVVFMTTAISTRLRKQEEAYRKANIELQRKDTIKNEYVLRLTHDIKGHLSAIQNSLDVVMITDNEEDKLEFTKRAYKRVKRVAHFVADLLKLTKMRLSSRVNMSKFSLSKSIYTVVKTLKPIAQKKNIHLEMDIGIEHDYAKGDRFSIEEVLNNLLYNSIKYTSENGSIYIYLMRRKDFLRVEIIDTGIGIPENDLEHIFDEFYRADNAKELEKEGTGIGLSIVKQIIESHDGTIKVTSAIGKGTKIYFTLPVFK